MESGGWRLPTFAAFMVTAAETAGGIGLLLGLLTPLAACAVVGRDDRRMGGQRVRGRVLVGAVQRAVPDCASARLRCCSPAQARYSVDARIFGSWRVGVRVAVGLLVVAIAAALLTWILLNGTNPIHFSSQ